MTNLDIITGIIKPIVNDTYGDSDFIDAMIEDVAKRIENYEYDEQERSRETVIMLRLWDWMSGGSTAEAAAIKIEDGLLKAHI